MIGDISLAENVYIACGHTDMRKSIDGLTALVQDHFKMDPFQSAVFIFCGKKLSDLLIPVLYTDIKMP